MTAETNRRRRGHDFYPPADVLAAVPPLYGTEDVALANKVIRLHYFVKDCDWWIVEYSPKENLAWGYACLGDPGCAEWGYVSLTELEALYQEGRLENEQGRTELRLLPRLIVERDLGWTPNRVSDAELPGRPM